MGSFSLDVAKFAGLVPRKMDMALRKVGLEVLSGITLGTPVDTGRARGNWQTTVGAPAEGDLDREDKTGALAIGAGAVTVNAWKPSDESSLFIANNLPYIEALENGHSKQAPAGMVGVTLARFQDIVRESIE